MRYKVIECDCGAQVRVEDTGSCFICPVCGNRSCEPHVIGYLDGETVLDPLFKLGDEWAAKYGVDEEFLKRRQEHRPPTKRVDLRQYGPRGVRGITKE